MPIDKPILTKLKKFAGVFKAARDRNATESDTVMYLTEFFKEVLGYDPLSGEITKEFPINDRYCDLQSFLMTRMMKVSRSPNSLLRPKLHPSRLLMRSILSRRKITLNVPLLTGCC